MRRRSAQCPARFEWTQFVRAVGPCLLAALLLVFFIKSEVIVRADRNIEPNISLYSPFLFTCDYYASPTGSPSGTGSLSNPWSLQTALSNSEVILAGSTLCLRGGTYRGKFQSILNGVTVRAAPNESPVIDGYLYTTLVGDIDLLTTTITVADASAFIIPRRDGGANSLIVDGEALFINSITGNTIEVTRAAAGSSTVAVPHLSGTLVRLAGDQLFTSGNNTTYQGIEIKNSDPLRNWITDGGEGLRGAGIFNTGNGNKFVNLVVHDNLNGIFSGSSSSNTEVYGTLSYNNGMFDNTAQGKGHGMYLENMSGYSRIYDNIVLNNFGLGTQCYGRTAAYLGGDLQGNVFSNSGAPLGLPLRHHNLLIGAETQRVPDILVQGNYLFHPHDINGYNMTYGYGAGVDDGRILNNYFVGGGGIGLELTDVTNVTATGNKFYTTNFLGVNIQAHELPYTINNNTYYSVQPTSREFGDATRVTNLTFANWQAATGFDSTSTITASSMPNTVIVRPNAYEAGRANIIVYVSSGAPSVSVNLSTSGLVNGQPYTIKNASNYNGAAAAAGVYNSASPTINLPLFGASSLVAVPVGSTYLPSTTLPQFGSFILIPSPIPATPTPTNTPTNTPTATSTSTNTATSTPTATPIAFVNGTITYGNAIGSPSTRYVSNVLISGAGLPSSWALSDFPNGAYSLGVGLGAYTVTPSKTGGQNNAINSFDAAKISTYVTGITTLNTAQQAAADVTGNGVVNSFDAAQVARYVVNMQPYGLTGTWKFTPANRTYLSVGTNLGGEDYSALLMGEVSGNWNNTGARPSNNCGPEKSASIAVANLSAPANGQIIVPISVLGISNRGIISYEFDLKYDPNVVQPLANPVETGGTLSRGLFAVSNSERPGLLRVVVYGPIPIESDGVLLNIKFIVVGTPGTRSPLIWERFLINDGEPQSLANGSIELLSAHPE